MTFVLLALELRGLIETINLVIWILGDIGLASYT